MKLELIRRMARRRVRRGVERLASAGWVVPGLTDLGLRGEALAVRALRRRGYRIIRGPAGAAGWEKSISSHGTVRLWSSSKSNPGEGLILAPR